MCDHCGGILCGKKGIADIHKDYIQIQGSSAWEQWDELDKKYRYKFLFPTSREALAFCDVKCMTLFMNTAIERAVTYLQTGDDYVSR
jgi:hypothetical protein